MRRWTPRFILLLVPLLLALAACGGGDSNGGPSGEFTTLSYNVGGLPQEVSQINPKDHIPLISPLINDYDIVLTQEDWDWWLPALDEIDFANYHTRLRAQTDFPYQSEQHPGNEAVGLDIETERPLLMVGDGLGILSRFPFDEFRRVPWAACGVAAADCLAMKGFGMARVELADGVTVDVYTLHAEAGSEDDDNTARAEGFADLAAYIEQNSVGRAIILGGDMNLHTDATDQDHPEDLGVWQTFLQRTGLTDVCDALQCADPTRIDKFAFRSSDAITLEPQTWEFEAEKGRPG
ncbi:MAG: endonuclease/exonuclease/phosphatase family protein [Dehalococcoidia bacterium]